MIITSGTSKKEIGFSLYTYYYIETWNWHTREYPLTYQFLYSYSSSGPYIPLTSKQWDPFTFTQLLLPPDLENMFITVLAIDRLGGIANTSISIYPSSIIPSTAISDVKEILNGQSKNNPMHNFKALSLLSDSLAFFEAYTKKSSKCPLWETYVQCGNISNCPELQQMQNCTFKEEDVRDTINIKASALEAMRKSFTLINRDQPMREVFLKNLNALSKEPIYNQNGNLQIIGEALEDTRITDTSLPLLADTELAYLTNILSNLISFVPDGAKDEFFINNLENKILKYLGVLAKSALQNKLPGEPETTKATPNIDVYVKRVTLCTLADQTINVSPDSPNIKLNVKPGASLTAKDCIVQVDIQYYAFNEQILINFAEQSKNSDRTSKSHISFSIDQTFNQEPVDIFAANIFEARLTMPQGASCPKGCKKTNKRNECYCEDIGIFDVKEQIPKILHESEISKLKNIDVLVEFHFWENIAFWSIMVCGVWFCSSFYIIKFKIPDFCVIEKIDVGITRSLFKKLRLLIQVCAFS